MISEVILLHIKKREYSDTCVNEFREKEKGDVRPEKSQALYRIFVQYLAFHDLRGEVEPCPEQSDDIFDDEEEEREEKKMK